MKPILAIVGRPHIGKSALFNRICKKRIAIVEETEGVTRDRLYSESDLYNIPFTVVDTGGIAYSTEDHYGDEIKRQARIAIQEADVLVMVVDGQAGRIPYFDHMLAKELLRTEAHLSSRD